MKSALSLLLFPPLLSIACHGTEVGNGRPKPFEPTKTVAGGSDAPTKDGTESGTGTSSGAGSNTDGATNDSETPSLADSIVPYLYAKCASPLAEIGVGEFAGDNTAKPLSVTLKSPGTFTVLIGADAGDITKAPTLSAPYAIATTHAGNDKMCQDVDTNAAIRTVVFSDQVKVEWTVDSSNSTESIRVLNALGQLVRTYTRK